MKTIFLDGNSLSIEDVILIIRKDYKIALTDEAIQKINKVRNYVDKIVSDGKTVYGITTGFGKFSDVNISLEETEGLQENLIISHACGVGPNFNFETTKAIMLLRINALAKGFSGIRLETLRTLIDMVNKNVIPCIPEKGSLGASGDLAPLAHMVLPMLGLGEAYFNGVTYSGKDAMDKASIKTIKLTSKEGLALINGTCVMTAVGLITAYDASKLVKLADISASLSLEALNGITDPFLIDLHLVRPHKGQLDTAYNMQKILTNSERTTRQGELRVQDPYVLRCIPQIHGASKDTINYVLDKITIEINSVTDNPVIVVDKDIAISGGNFHGQPMALPFDFLAIGIAEIANVSERRTERLVNPQLSNGLPAFLTEDGGFNSGFMIAQYSAASLVSENKILAHPASVDSIPSSANQEDHVSMGTIAARKARDIYFNASRVIAIELLSAAQGIDLNKTDAGKKLGQGTSIAYKIIREHVDKLENDRIMYLDINKIADLIDTHAIIDEVEKEIGKLNL